MTARAGGAPPRRERIPCRPRLARAALVGLALAAGACASAVPKPETAAVPAALSPPPPSPREQLAAPHATRAERLEKEGRLHEALAERKIALTISPDSATSQEARKRLEALIGRAVADRMQEARSALARGSQVQARRLLLAALGLDPQNRPAFDALVNEAREVEMVDHAVKPGDTLASLAQRYYGNKALAEVIAETNQISPAARLAPGTVVRIPEVPGVPLQRPETRREAAPSKEASREAGAREEPAETNPLLLEARESLERKEYVLALADAEKLLAAAPGNPEALGIKKAALYSQGKLQLEKKQYRASYGTLGQLAKLAPDYENSAALIQEARARLIEYHYGNGIRLYREEKLPEAIAEWRAVLELDPQHAAARKNLEQSERLEKGLEERRRR